MSLNKHKQDWEELGKLDPLWAVITAKKGKYGNWDLDEFFQTGEEEIAMLMENTERLGYPKERGSALDFGCGVGRLTRPLAGYFTECCGIDISESMIAKAEDLNALIPNCKFLSNQDEHLKIFPDNSFDLIYTRLVLQHVPKICTIKSYIAEFMRILKPGGLLAFQLPSRIPFKKRIQPRRRLYSFLRTLGFNSNFLYNRLGLCPIKMKCIPEKEVLAFLNSLGGKVLEVYKDTSAGKAIESRMYYVTTNDLSGEVCTCSHGRTKQDESIPEH